MWGINMRLIWWTVAKWARRLMHLIVRFDEDFSVAAQRVLIISCQLFGIRWILEDEVVFHVEKKRSRCVWCEVERTSKIFHPKWVLFVRWWEKQRGREWEEFWWLQAGQGASIWCWWRWRKEAESVRMFSSRSCVQRRLLVEHLKKVLLEGIF